jgi:VPDSG-CTERM motif
LPNDADLTVNDRFGSTGSFTDSYGSFTITQVDTAMGPTYELTYSLNPGFVLAGVGIHGGGSTSENYWSVNDGTSGTNEGSFHGALAGKSGTYAALSNFDILLEPAESTAVPDGGSTAMLLGIALTGVSVVRRWVKR